MLKNWEFGHKNTKDKNDLNYQNLRYQTKGMWNTKVSAHWYSMLWKEQYVLVKAGKTGGVLTQLWKNGNMIVNIILNKLWIIELWNEVILLSPYKQPEFHPWVETSDCEKRSGWWDIC